MCAEEQIASLLGAAESIMAVEEMHSFMAERNRAALDASFLLFGAKGIIKAPEMCVGCVLPQQRRVGSSDKPAVVVKTMSDGWQPRWPGDLGDPFEPYTVRALQSSRCLQPWSDPQQESASLSLCLQGQGGGGEMVCNEWR